MTDNVIDVYFEKAEPQITQFYSDLEDALNRCPEGMTIAEVLGVLEIFKANILRKIQITED